MPKDDSAKTASAPKLKITSSIYFVIFFVLASLLMGYLLTQNSSSNKSTSVCETNPALDTKELKINNVMLVAEVASSQSEKYKGLSGRNCIEENRAMLFTYETPGSYCFVMRDMNFPIDMVWLDEDKKIVTIQNNAKPENYPAESYCPTSPSKYIVEVDSGLARKLRWATGTQFMF